MERSNITPDDEGKKVVNNHGDEVGMVNRVEGDEAFVKPDAGLTDSIRTKLGWEDRDDDEYRLSTDHIHTVTDDEIRLKD